MSSATSPRVLVETVGGVTVASFADAELISEEIIGRGGRDVLRFEVRTSDLAIVLEG